MNTNNLEIPLLVVASIFTIEFLESWLGISLTLFIMVITIISVIQYIRNWNKDHNEEKRAEEKRAEEHEKHILEMDILRKKLKDTSNNSF